MSSSMTAITWGAFSAKVTFRPCRHRFSQASRPMKPPPTTKASVTPDFSMYSRSPTASSTVRKVKTPFLSLAKGGTMGVAPVAMTNLS